MPCGWAARVLRPLSDGFRGPAHHRKQPRGKRSQVAKVSPTPGSPACCRGGATGFPSSGPPEPGALYPSGRSCWVTEIVRGPGHRRALSRGGRGGGPRLAGGGGGTPGLPQLSEEAGGQCQPPWPIFQVVTERAPPSMNQDRRVLAPGASSSLLSPPPRRSPFLSKALLPLEGEKRKKKDPRPCLP